MIPRTVNITAVLPTLSYSSPLCSVLWTPFLSSPLEFVHNHGKKFQQEEEGGSGRPEHERHVIGQEAGTTLTWLAVCMGAVRRVPSLFQRASVSSGVGLAVLEMQTRYFCLFWFLWLGLSESRQKTLYGSQEWINTFLELSQKDIK